MRPRDGALPESYRRSGSLSSTRELMLGTRHLAIRCSLACALQADHIRGLPFQLGPTTVMTAGVRIRSRPAVKACVCRGGLPLAAEREDQNVG